MSVWLTIPSARPPEEAAPILRQWRERGYKIALSFDTEDELHKRSGMFDLAQCPSKGDSYPGYAKAVNDLVQRLLVYEPDADWFIAAGDDALPDPNKSAEEIAWECNHHFSLEFCLRSGQPHDIVRYWPERTFGVMQPTGDRWQEGAGGFESADIDRVCGSAWMGREFCKRIYGGKGPLWPEFKHMFVDEHLQCVAQKLGILWQRRDLTQKHLHWKRGLETTGIQRIPEHAVKWNTDEHWQEAKQLFERLKAGGFKEAEELL
jgi:hypothetical protein